MKPEVTSKSVSFDGAYMLAVIVWVVALHFLLEGQWEWTLMLSLFGALLFCFAYWRGKRKKPLHDVVVVISIIGFFLSASLFTAFVSEHLNKTAPQQLMCGQIMKITESTGREMARFELQSNQQVKTFLYVDKHPELMQLNKKLCLTYSIHPKWSRHPYIHVITEQK